MRRELLLVPAARAGGYVEVARGGTGSFSGNAAQVFATLRTIFDDDDRLAAGLIADGWSNGYVYLGPVEDG